ncbi:TPA: hypothetical protein NO897_002222 [Klebsiella quasipneumoniae subsp. similipneumoniae]|uniref:hypothetical protein n=1 Tax=Enterobacteriaceae TaxID=543 RepID=UPI0011E884FD|nr:MULTISPECIES: hypothetical protein [Enterobacteriaceae]HCD6066320.1 hypothetical protein [Klebsiella oxytoca]HCI4592188.1 hypothetical protein [Klebsiella quasipneumoniae subsp. similipneumoniae]EHF5016571.1 hypothetical protein [Enterobacter hormaechei]MBZ7619112.1 hypothetical protein [Klebsiella michiganensis]MCE0120519.1 hypothetical protein [Klebsiella variicola subsp. variicola]
MSDNNELCSCDAECTDVFFSMVKDQVQSMYSLLHQERRLISEEEKRRVKQWFRDALSDMRGWSRESKTRIVNGKVNDCYEQSHLKVGVFGKDIDCYLDAAGILFWWGQYTWKRGDLGEGIRAMLRAAHCLGAWQGAHHQLDKQEECQSLSEVRSEAGKKGAKSKRALFEPVKKEFLSLIEEHMPAEGWKSRAQAIKIVAPELRVFIAGLKIMGKPSEIDLERLIGDWCRNKKSPEFGKQVNEMLNRSGI